MKKYQIHLNFIRDLIGSQPSNSEIKQAYITKKMMTGRTGMSADVAINRVKEEIANLEKDENYQNTISGLNDKTLTVFFRDKNGNPSISDVQLRGFFKAAFAFVGREQSLLKKKSGESYASDEYYRKWIGERIMFPMQYIPFLGCAVKIMERPIQCQTMQGPRVSLTASETIEAPISIEFELVTTDDVPNDWISLILQRGLFRGISQWSNAQYGTFTYAFLQQDVVA